MSVAKTGRALKEIKIHAKVLAWFVGIMWTVECVDFFLGGSLRQFGIYPRNLVGLRGIFFAPFLHANFQHLIANTVPFVTLGWFVMLRRTRDFFWVTAVSMLVGGLGTWLIAPSGTVHIGASGVIFGYLGFLLSRGYFERSIISILASLAVAFFYGGLLWGVLPNDAGVSWQGHLFGCIGGMIAASRLSKK